MQLKVNVYDKIKYNKDSKFIAEVRYDNAVTLEVKAIPDEEVYRMGFDTVDEFGEYAVISFEDGTTATFRNSHVNIYGL